MKLTDEKIRELKWEKAVGLNVISTLDRKYLSSNDLMENILRLMIENICNFEQLTNNLVGTIYFSQIVSSLLYHKKYSELLIKRNKLANSDLKCLLNRIDSFDELDALCRNEPLIKHILNEFILDKEIIDKFNERIENHFNRTRIKRKDPSIIYMLKARYKNNKDILKSIELNRYVYSFDEDQTLELIEVLKNNEVAKARLNYIVDNQLESQFDFESLMKYLKKKEKKNLLNI